MNHLHTHDLLHMDIKPENILMTKDKICKLGDFGRVFDQKNDKKDVAEEGDSKYLALEILNNPPTKAADIFSVGMTILEVNFVRIALNLGQTPPLKSSSNQLVQIGL